MNPDGSTSGITSVLVFGAGTNYALLLISRYREELGRNENHRDAHSDVAVRRAGPAILASNATVVLALLTLVFASSPSTRSLGVQAASGLVVAAVFVLLVLPPLLALFGKRLFWPFIPQRRHETRLPRAVFGTASPTAVARRPGIVATVAVAALAALCTGLLATPIGLSQTEQFRVQAESVSGYQTLAAHFPSGLTDPTRVIGPTDRARRDPTRDHGHARRRVGDTGRPVHGRTEPVVGRPERRTRVRQTRSKPLMRCVIRFTPSIRARWSADPTPRPAMPAPPRRETGWSSSRRSWPSC